MKIYADYVSVSESGDYYQVMFEQKDPNGEEDGTDAEYILIQRQFESPDGGRIYVESHDENYIGHFKVAGARLDPKRLSLALDRKDMAVIEVTFETSA